jgi:hypothetical protein
MNKILDVLKYFGVNKVVIGWMTVLIMTATTASSITIFMLDFKKSIDKIEQLSQSVERIENQLKDYSTETNSNLIIVEGAIVDLSVLHERVSKDQYELFKEFIQDNRNLTILYNQKLLRLEELNQDYLPTRNSFKIGVRPKSK